MRYVICFALFLLLLVVSIVVIVVVVVVHLGVVDPRNLTIEFGTK